MELNKEQLENTLKQVTQIAFVYLDNAANDIKATAAKPEDEPNKQLNLSALHSLMSILLDITHRTYPTCYDLFEQNKENFDNAVSLFQRFQAAGLLKQCPCDFCKTLSNNTTPELTVETPPTTES